MRQFLKFYCVIFLNFPLLFLLFVLNRNKYFHFVRSFLVPSINEEQKQAAKKEKSLRKMLLCYHWRRKNVENLKLNKICGAALNFKT